MRPDILREAFNEKKKCGHFPFFPQQMPAWPPLIGCCLFSDDLILIVLKGFDPFLSDCLSINHSNLSIHIRNNLDLH